eukprot:TRINITY_DN9034_c0_g1_i1.p1 TRINITY_DN9034_c0_g1~~TRINITY_DN9034_c0_g1_i1.p1  ORF type:complete len:819 (+),score=86.98 TRINITY_DN9034_c0_g1_i1:726-3182(+)
MEERGVAPGSARRSETPRARLLFRRPSFLSLPVQLNRGFWKHFTAYQPIVDGEDEEVVPDHGSRLLSRDIIPASAPRKFTRKQFAQMCNFEARDFYEPVTRLYKDHLLKDGQRQSAKHLRSKWLMMCLVGLIAGLIGFAIKETIDALVLFKKNTLAGMLSPNNKINAWLFLAAFNAFLATVASCVVTYVQPVASGSGLPEVMGELNGLHLPGVFRVRTLVVKVISVVMSVSSGLPVGAQGPLIHIGAMLGAGISQGQSRALRFQSRLAFFRQFRNARDQYDFVCAGSAAGVAAAFCAPVGGLLFVMESVASWWDQNTLNAMIFCVCLVTSWVDTFLASAYNAWQPTGHFGMMDYKVMNVFEHPSTLPFHVLAIVPAVLIGMCCGLLGVAFTVFHLAILRFRANHIVPHPHLRVFEVAVLCIGFTSLMYWLPFVLPCEDLPANASTMDIPWVTKVCAQPAKEYSPFATLSFVRGTDTIAMLLAPYTRHTFPYHVLLLYLAIYFLFAAVVAGTAISSGVVIPVLVLGAVVGRLLGNACCDIVEHMGTDMDWFDPGIFAYLGAASFFAGVSRLTVSLAVIMVEMTGDVHHLFALMLSVQVAKWVGDHFTHSLYHTLLVIKGIPVLDPEVHLSEILHTLPASAVMTSPVKVITPVETLGTLTSLLKQNSHNAYPVVDSRLTMELIGVITRAQLESIVSTPSVLVELARAGTATNNTDAVVPIVSYSSVSSWDEKSYLMGRVAAPVMPAVPNLDPNTEIALHSYVDQSPFCIDAAFSLRHAYGIFRTMGLRHLLVVQRQRLVGIITRKDLLCPPTPVLGNGIV